jgi:hypothetical protein
MHRHGTSWASRVAVVCAVCVPLSLSCAGSEPPAGPGDTQQSLRPLPRAPNLQGSRELGTIGPVPAPASIQGSETMTLVDETNRGRVHLRPLAPLADEFAWRQRGVRP